MTSRDNRSMEQLELFEEAASPSGPPQEPIPSPPKELTEAEARAEKLNRFLCESTGLVIHLTITDNSRNMMAIRRFYDPPHVKVRLHHMFLTAPPEILKAVIHWISHPGSKKYSQLFRNFFIERAHEISRRDGASPFLMPRGWFHDLQRIFDEVNATYFRNSIKANITWSASRRSSTRTRRFGSYSFRHTLVRVNRCLDQRGVPEFIVRYIVFHEMLHAALGETVSETGRRQVHHRKFRELEKRYPDYERAEAWLKAPENLGKLYG